MARSTLLDACSEGTVVRPHRGVFALPQTPRPAVLASIFRGEPCCLSWCAEAGLPVYPSPDAVHLAVPQPRGMGHVRKRPRHEVVVHRAPFMPRTTADHIDLAGLCCGPREQLALVDAALRTGAIDHHAIEAFTHGSPDRRRWLSRMADARAESLSETCARVELMEAGLDVVPQVQLNAVGRVDFLVEGVLVVEIDSEAHHSGERARARDGDRDRASTTQGYLHLRYMFHDALERPQEMVADVIATLMRFGHLTPTVRTKLAAAARVSGWRSLQ